MEKQADQFDEIAKKAWEAVFEAVKKMKAKGMTLEEIAKKIGAKNRALVGEWLNENRVAVNTPFPTMLRYLNAVGRSINDFIEPQHTIRRIGPNAPEVIISGSNLQTVPVYARVGAGPAVEGRLTELEPLFSVTAPPSYFYKSDFAVVVDGHSMEPTIPHQAVVGVREVCEFRANELYVACIPYEGLVIKRVAVDRERGEFVFKSDNPDKEAYPDFREAVDSAMKIIMGRVVWLMIGY